MVLCFFELFTTGCIGLIAVITNTTHLEYHGPAVPQGQSVWREQSVNQRWEAVKFSISSRR